MIFLLEHYLKIRITCVFVFRLIDSWDYQDLVGYDNLWSESEYLSCDTYRVFPLKFTDENLDNVLDNLVHEIVYLCTKSINFQYKDNELY